MYIQGNYWLFITLLFCYIWLVLNWIFPLYLTILIYNLSIQYKLILLNKITVYTILDVNLTNLLIKVQCSLDEWYYSCGFELIIKFSAKYKIKFFKKHSIICFLTTKNYIMIYLAPLPSPHRLKWVSLWEKESLPLCCCYQSRAWWFDQYPCPNRR